MKKNLIVFFSIAVFCVTSVFAQNTESEEEKLITDFIKLKNVPACDEKDSTNCIGQKIGYKNFFSVTKIYLTRRGAIEIDTRSKTVILTETASNLELMKAIISSADRYEIFLLGENEEDIDLSSSCKGFAGSPLK